MNFFSNSQKIGIDQRKGRKGAFWEDRYHATAIENGEHLARCLVYIDTNMVRAGAVGHPCEWPFCGYDEIQRPRRKSVLIDYRRLQNLVGVRSYDELMCSHRGWVEQYLAGRVTPRQEAKEKKQKEKAKEKKD